MSLNKERIIEEALHLLNEDGLEGVTLRKIAKNLEVYASALYWHFKNKGALVNEMAEAILIHEFSTVKPCKENERWQDWLIDIFVRLRRALLTYKDGGRVVSGAHFSLIMARISEESIKTLYNANVPLRKARLIVLIATRYTFGYVIEEQNLPSAKIVESFDQKEFASNHPLTIQAIEEYFATGKSSDDLFYDGLKIMIDH